MKITSIVARYMLGLIFTVFGLNGFLNFIHQPPPANPLAMQFFVAVSASHFAAFFFALQVLGGVLLLLGYFVPLDPLTGVGGGALQHPRVSLDSCAGDHRSGSAGLCTVATGLLFTYRDSFKGIFIAKACDAAMNCVAVIAT